MLPLRIYADRTHYVESERKSLNDILKALWNDSSLDERRRAYGSRVELFELASSADTADLHVLPMKWQYYVDRGRIDQAMRVVDGARRAKRPLVVFSVSDFEANFPAHDGIHLFQASAYRSRRRTGNHAYPAFFADPLEGRDVETRPKTSKAVVGFCGQAGASIARHAARYVRNRLNRALWKAGRIAWEPPPLEHTWFRQKVIDQFQRSTLLESRFVLRTRYRAGVSGSAHRETTAEQSRREFIENVLGTDYTLSMRGGGNFSVRFYEALAMGRIPVFIDTDCVVPYMDQVAWKTLIPWIPEERLSDADRIVSEFHARLGERELAELQRECRQLWQARLTPDGFYRHFREHFPELS